MIRGYDGASTPYGNPAACLLGFKVQEPLTPQSAAYGPGWFEVTPPVQASEPVNHLSLAEEPSTANADLANRDLMAKRLKTIAAIAATVAAGILFTFGATSSEEPPSQPGGYSTNY